MINLHFMKVEFSSKSKRYTLKILFYVSLWYNVQNYIDALKEALRTNECGSIILEKHNFKDKLYQHEMIQAIPRPTYYRLEDMIGKGEWYCLAIFPGLKEENLSGLNIMVDRRTGKPKRKKKRR